MENSAYVPNPLPPPALVVFSQAGGLPDALRMQRPFNPQPPEVKDLHIPFSATGFGLRHMDSYPGLPAHLLHHLQPQFLHPALDPRVPFGSGAFRPLSSSVVPEAKGFPSAFAPPSKCLKIETSNGSGHQHDSSSLSSNHLTSLYSPDERAYQLGSQQRADSSSPASVSVSPPLPPIVKEESSDAPMSEDREGTPCSEGTERSTPEEGRGFRLGAGGRCSSEALGISLGLMGYRLTAVPPRLPKGRCLLFDQDGAPRARGPAQAYTPHSLGMKMWHWQLPPGLARSGPVIFPPRPHLPTQWAKKKFPTDPSCCPVCGMTVRTGELEVHFVQELERLYKVSASSRLQRRLSMTSQGPTTSSGPRRDGISSAADGTPEGRWDTYQRIKANRQGRLRIKNRKRKADETTCPVCSDRLQGSLEQLNGHVESCLRKHGGAPEEDENVDVEGDSEVYEEYEWAGQRRIRATTLLVGGFSASGMATSSNRRSPVDDDVDLVVDGDDTTTYGPPQYAEADLDPYVVNETREEECEAIIETNSGDSSKQRPSPTSTPTSGGVEVKCEPSSSHPPDLQSVNQVLEALKSRIRELEGETGTASHEMFKCLICMEKFKKPVISICCWHVHCEECWLHTLGIKKLCPQCNMITSPSDLRKIYM